MDLNQVLIEAAKDANMLVLKTALEKGADVNVKDSSGMTALMYAEQKEYAVIVNFLKEKVNLILFLRLLRCRMENLT